MYDIIKDRMAKSVPFASTTGVEIESVGSGHASARLVQRREVSNHIGTMHAGALFTLGETASGAAMSGAFASRLMEVRPVATAASISYVKTARGTIVAHAVARTPAENLLATLAEEGRVAFEVDVAITDEGDATVATMNVGWLVSQR